MRRATALARWLPYYWWMGLLTGLLAGQIPWILYMGLTTYDGL